MNNTRRSFLASLLFISLGSSPQVMPASSQETVRLVVQMGHHAPVTAVAVAADGSAILTGDRSQPIQQPSP